MAPIVPPRDYSKLVDELAPAGSHGGARPGAGRPAKEQTDADQSAENQSDRGALIASDEPAPEQPKSGKPNHSPERVIARLKRDQADEDQPAEVRQKASFLLAGIERGEVKPHGAANPSPTSSACWAMTTRL